MQGSQQTAAVMLGVAALLALPLILIALRRARAHGDWDLTSTLVFLVGIVAVVPVGLFVIHSGQPVRLDPFGTVIVTLPGWATRLGQLGEALLAGCCLLFTAVRVLSGARWNAAPVIAGVLVLVTAFSDGLNGNRLFAPQQLVLLLVLLAATFARPGRAALVGAAAVGLVLAVVGGMEALMQASSVLRPCREDKCGPLGFLYTGVFTNENTYGLLLALATPFVWLALRGRLRVILACYTASMAVATGGRTATAAAVAAILFLVLLRPELPESGLEKVPVGRSVLGALGLFGASLYGVLLPFLTRNSESLSERAYYWQLAERRLPESPLYGFGAKAWEGLYRAGEIPVALTYSVHNQWLDVLYKGGLIGLGIFVVLLVYIAVRGGAPNFAVVCCVLAPVMVAGSAERPWSFGTYDWLTFTLVAATLLPVRLRPARPRPTAEPPTAEGSRSSPAVATARRPHH